MAIRALRGALPLALAAVLALGACDDEEEGPKVVEVEADKGVEVRVRHKDDSADEMIIVGELALFTGVIVWALFGPGATRRREFVTSEHRQNPA